MAYVPKWTDEHRAFILPLWNDGHTAAEIAQRVNRQFGTKATRGAIIGIVSRAGGEKRANCGIWRVTGAAKRLATMAANGTPFGPKPKKPTSEALRLSAELLAPIGIPGEFAEDGACKWPVNQDGQEYQVCGHPVEERKPYCQGHCRVSYTPATKPRTVGDFRSDRIR